MLSVVENGCTRRILCVGVTPCLQRTIRFSGLRFGQVNRARSVAVSSGGKSTNVARTLKALKESPLVTGFAGGETGNTMLLNETLAWRFTPPAVHVLNTVGSGDATTAGIAAGLVRGQSMPDAVQLGIACGSANAMTLTPGDLDADLVKKLVPEVAGVVGRGSCQGAVVTMDSG